MNTQGNLPRDLEDRGVCAHSPKSFLSIKHYFFAKFLQSYRHTYNNLTSSLSKVMFLFLLGNGQQCFASIPVQG